MNFRTFLILLFITSCFASNSQVRTGQVTDYLLPEFVMGDVVMKNGSKLKLKVNFEKINGQMVVIKNNTVMALGGDEADKIDSVYMEGRIFISEQNRFLESVHNGKLDLYAEYITKIDEAGTDIGYGMQSDLARANTLSTRMAKNGEYEVTANDYAKESKIIYWVRKEGQLYDFTSFRNLTKLFKDRKKQIKGFINEDASYYGDNNSVAAVIKFIESVYE